MQENFLYHVKYLLITVCLGAVTFLACYFATVQNRFLDLIIKATICIVLPTALYYLIYRKTALFKESIKIMNLRKKEKED